MFSSTLSVATGGISDTGRTDSSSRRLASWHGAETPSFAVGPAARVSQRGADHRRIGHAVDGSLDDTPHHQACIRQALA